MATNFLPNGENATVLFAEAYFKADGDTRFRHMGIVDQVSWTPEVEVAEKSWKNEIVATMTTTKSATLAVTLGEARWETFRASFMSSETTLTQTAGTIDITASNILPGEIVEIHKFDVANLEVEAAGVALIAGVDYVYDPKTDYVKFYTAQTSVTISGTAAASSTRKALSLMSEDNGIKGEFKFEGVNSRGIKLLLAGIRAELRPDGDVVISAESGGEFQSFNLTGKVIRNPASQAHPFGYAVEI
ncbi:MAG: hypothetical protein FJX25_09865 [Alphaproteobacteria bacterium]|nr:hypothetical protein [Alphaproteobacteria bacterium]